MGLSLVSFYYQKKKGTSKKLSDAHEGILNAILAAISGTFEKVGDF